MSLLRVEEVGKNFRGLVALRRISLSVEEGECLGLIGPNGAGKTTLFNVISGYYRPSGGRIFFHGEEITGLSPHEVCRRGLARTFQIPRPLVQLTLTENVMVATMNRVGSIREARLRAVGVLEKLGLAEKRDRRPGELTTADRKKLEVARALGSSPRLLLLDEVTSGLTPAERAELVVLIKGIARQEGITLFVIDHVMWTIMRNSDRIVVLHYGEKIAEGTPAEIASNAETIKSYLGEEYVFA